MEFSSVIVTCFALSTAVATCCWCSWDRKGRICPMIAFSLFDISACNRNDELVVRERDEYLDFRLSSSFSFLTRHSGSTTQPICISFDGERSHSITFTLLTFRWTIVLFNEGKSREFFGLASEREDFFFKGETWTILGKLRTMKKYRKGDSSRAWKVW